MRRNDVLSTKIADQPVTVQVVYEAVNDERILLRVDSMQDALVACQCYKGQQTKIERAADKGWLVVVFKKSEETRKLAAALDALKKVEAHLAVYQCEAPDIRDAALKDVQATIAQIEV